MADFRHFADITPWNKEGSSWMGLTRDQAKKVAWFFIVLGLILMDPPFSPLPTDFLNIGLATFMAKHLTVLSFNTWLLLTYTLIGFSIFMFGLWVYPYNTMTLLGAYVARAKFYFKQLLKKPWFLVLGLIVFLVFIKWYKVKMGLV